MAGISTCQFQGQVTSPNVTGKRRNVLLNNSLQAVIDPRPLNLKSSSLPNELKRYPTRALLVVVLLNPKLLHKNKWKQICLCEYDLLSSVFPLKQKKEKQCAFSMNHKQFTFTMRV